MNAGRDFVVTEETGGAGRERAPRPIAVVFQNELNERLSDLADDAAGVFAAASLWIDGGDVVHYVLSARSETESRRGVPGVALVVRDATAPGAAPADLIRRADGHLPAAPPLRQLLVLPAAGEPPRPVRSWSLRDGAWIENELMVVPDFAHAFDRHVGLLESAALARKKVAVVGLGSGGSTMAVELAKAGVGRFLLVDHDRLEIANVARHTCDLSHIGRRKTLALRDQIRAKNPYADVSLLDGDVVLERDRFREFAQDCDVIVGATDSNRSRGVLNRIALDLGIPIIFGRAYVRACGGDVIRVRPGDGPCYQCLVRNVAAEEEVSSARSAQASAYADQEVTIEPGLALDIAPIALMGTRLVIQELVRGTDSTLTTLDDDLVAPLYIWANRREKQFARWKPMRFTMSQLAVQRWYGFRVDRDPTCPVCNETAFLANLEAELAAS